MENRVYQRRMLISVGKRRARSWNYLTVSLITAMVTIHQNGESLFSRGIRWRKSPFS
jgi:hypothetical protein